MPLFFFYPYTVFLEAVKKSISPLSLDFKVGYKKQVS